MWQGDSMVPGVRRLWPGFLLCDPGRRFHFSEPLGNICQAELVTICKLKGLCKQKTSAGKNVEKLEPRALLVECTVAVEKSYGSSLKHQAQNYCMTQQVHCWVYAPKD